MVNLTKFLKERFPKGIQMFSTEFNFGGNKEEIYNDGDYRVIYCQLDSFIEVIGLSKDQFINLNNVINENNEVSKRYSN